jgi:hypothetical protein
MRKVLLAFFPVLLCSSVILAQSQPSAKATAAVADVHLLVSSSSPTSPDSDSSGWKTILGNQIKTPNGKDLFINASLECGIYSNTLVRSSGGVTDASLASGGVRVRVVVDPVTANTGSGPSASGFYASPAGGHDVTLTDGGTFTHVAAGQGVSYCKRIQYLSATLQGIIDLNDGGCFDADSETECTLTEEEIQLVLATLDANAFNFIAENLSSGVHLVEVQAKLDTSATSTKGSASAKAFVGMGSVTIEEVRMIKNEVIDFTLP